MEVPSEEPAPKRPKLDDQWRLERTLTTPATSNDEAQYAFDAVKGKERHRMFQMAVAIFVMAIPE